MTLDNSVSGYQGFEDPMMQYYGSTADNIPTVYTKSYQTRQFGVGQANTIGRAPSVAAALDSPPTAMTTAETDSITHATALYVVTAADVFNCQAATPDVDDGGGP